jgi:transposase
MRVAEHHTEEALQALAKDQDDARLRVQLQAIVLAKQKRPAPDIAKNLGHGRRTVQQWVHDYNLGGIKGLADKRGGNHRHLTPEQEQQLRQRLDAGPTPEDGVCSLRAADVRSIIQNEFGKVYKPSGVYDLLHRLGYSYLCPRPRHPQSSQEAQDDFKKTLARRSSKFRRTIPISRCGSISRTRPALANRAR